MVEDVPLVAGPLAGHAADVAHVHVILPVVPEDLGCPERVAAPRGVESGDDAAIEPCSAAVIGGGDAEAGAVDPGDTVGLHVGTTVGVDHPPGALLPVPHHHRVGRAVVDGVAKERPIRSLRRRCRW